MAGDDLVRASFGAEFAVPFFGGSGALEAAAALCLAGGGVVLAPEVLGDGAGLGAVGAFAFCEMSAVLAVLALPLGGFGPALVGVGAANFAGFAPVLSLRGDFLDTGDLGEGAAGRDFFGVTGVLSFGRATGVEWDFPVCFPAAFPLAPGTGLDCLPR